MRPNIIIVMTDQHRADLRKGAGYSIDTMPFLDEWSKGGADFLRAYTPNPTCVPARVSMFTGRYPQTHRARTNHNTVDALYTEDLLDLLRAQGYISALCGKNHSHRKNEEFDYYRTNGHVGGCSYPLDESQKEFDAFMRGANKGASDGLAPGGAELQYPFRNVTHSLDFIDNHTGGKPFFLWLSFAEPHGPYQAPAPYFDMFPPESLPAAAGEDIPPELKGRRFKWAKDMLEKAAGGDTAGIGMKEKTLRMRSNYHGMLRLIDDQFKRFVNALSERRILEDTLIIFLSDHGDFAGEYGMMRKGPDLPEVLTRIPMVWRGPGVTPQGAVDGCFVNTVDILPTLCDMLKLESPFGCQGKSILPLLAGKDIPENEFDCAYSESGYGGLYWDGDDALDPAAEGALSNGNFDALNTWTQCGQVRMLRKGDYKIQLDMLGAGYLYDIKNDPAELKNLWDDAGALSIRADMLTALSAVMMRNTDPIPAPHNRYRIKTHPKGYWRQKYHESDASMTKTPPLWRIAKKEHD